jgi:hypothetical protein
VAKPFSAEFRHDVIASPARARRPCRDHPGLPTSAAVEAAIPSRPAICTGPSRFFHRRCTILRTSGRGVRRGHWCGRDLLQMLTRLTVACDVHDIVAELLGVGLGTVNILPAAPLGTTDQMSPVRAAVPIDRMARRGALAGASHQSSPRSVTGRRRELCKEDRAEATPNRKVMCRSGVQGALPPQMGIGAPHTEPDRSSVRLASVIDCCPSSCDDLWRELRYRRWSASQSPSRKSGARRVRRGSCGQTRCCGRVRRRWSGRRWH